jgi:hypothetical protein
VRAAGHADDRFATDRDTRGVRRGQPLRRRLDEWGEVILGLCKPFSFARLPPCRSSVDVTVKRVDLRDDGCVVAICARGGIRQPIPILDLPLPDPPPDGAEWINAYRHWAS